MNNNEIKSLGGFTWSITGLFQGDLRQSENGKVALSFVVLRDLDCILPPTKNTTLSLADTLRNDIGEIARSHILYAARDGDISAYNTNRITFARMRPRQACAIHKSLRDFTTPFSSFCLSLDQLSQCSGNITLCSVVSGSQTSAVPVRGELAAATSSPV